MQWPDTEEVDRSLGAGFATTWQVASSYRITNGVLHPEGPVKRSYLPGAYPQIVTDLAKIDAGGDDAILTFANTWGSLGYAKLVKADRSLSRDERERQVDLVRGGDPLTWIRAHARGIQVCLDLLARLRSDAPDAEQHLKAYLDVLRAAGAGYSQLEGDPVVIYAIRHHRPHVAGFDGAYVRDDETIPRGLARQIISSIVSPNLLGVRPQLDNWHAAHGFALNYDFAGLIDIAYWHLAQLVLSGSGLGRCRECGAYFHQTDRRQRFCPPEEWEAERGRERGIRVESRCAKRVRMRRLRAQTKGTHTQEGEEDG